VNRPLMLIPGVIGVVSAIVTIILIISAVRTLKLYIAFDERGLLLLAVWYAFCAYAMLILTLIAFIYGR
jgi:hypothetical protein